MPIELSLIRDPSNRCILAKGDQLVSEVMEELKIEDGENWWHLVVELGDGRFAAIQFLDLTHLAQAEGNDFFDRPLGSLLETWIPVVDVVEQSAIGTQAAKDRAHQSQGRVLVVTQDRNFLGIIYQGEAAGELDERPLLTIYNEYITSRYNPAEPPEVGEDQLKIRPRYIQAKVYEAVRGQLHLIHDHPLLGDHDYTVYIRIGAPDPKWLGPTRKRIFPDHLLSRTSHPLRVFFFEPFHAPIPQVQKIWLPVYGHSSAAVFHFHTLTDRADFEARAVILYENRILQTALIRSRVLTEARPTVEDGEAGLHLVIEAVVRDNLSELERNQAFGASVVLNHNLNDEPCMQAFAGETGVAVKLGRIQSLLDRIKDDLGAVYRNPERFNGGLFSDASQELLWKLAVNGNLLFANLHDNQGFKNHPLWQASHIQIVSANVASFLPLEYLYDHEAPRIEPPAPLCPNSIEALRSGECQCQPVNESEVICPLGFWGMRKVIERFAFDRLENLQIPQGEEFIVYAGVNGDQNELAPLRRVIYAASDKVDEDADHPNQIQAVLSSLQSVSGNNTHYVTNWEDWRSKVQQVQPSMLVLLPHNKINLRLPELHGLEISLDKTRWYTDLRSQDVKGQDSEVRPLVLLLGCETMSPDIPYESFVARFLYRGAAIVLGTTTSVLGFHAAPIACKVSQLMQSIINNGTNDFADVMLSLRRQSMLEGYPMVLSLFAYGDAAWKLVPA